MSLSSKSGKETNPLRRLSYSTFEVHSGGIEVYGICVDGYSVCFNIFESISDKVWVKFRIRGKYHIFESKVAMIDFVSKIAFLDFDHPELISLSSSKINTSPGDEVYVLEPNKRMVYIDKTMLSNFHESMVYRVNTKTKLGSSLISLTGEFLAICVGCDESSYFLPISVLRKIFEQYTKTQTVKYSDFGYSKYRAVSFGDAIKFGMDLVSGFLVEHEGEDAVLLSVSDGNKRYEFGEAVGFYSVFYFSQRMGSGVKVILELLTLKGKISIEKLTVDKK